MDYFERSQVVKSEIKADSALVSLICGQVKGLSRLGVIGRGTMNVVYRVGQTGSGLWVALRENSVWGQMRVARSQAASIYNNYCLDAEGQPPSEAPAFCIGGLCEGQPFLLVEDVTNGGEYQVQCSEGGEKRVVLEKGVETRIRAVDLGDDNPYKDVNSDTQRKMCSGTFDIGSLKYFGPGARLDL